MSDGNGSIDHGHSVCRFSRRLELSRNVAAAPLCYSGRFGHHLDDVTPCFLWIFLAASYIDKLRGNEAHSTALSTATAAAVAVVLNLIVWFGWHILFPGSTLVDWIAILIGTVAWIGMMRWQWNIILVVLGAGGAGLLFKFFL